MTNRNGALAALRPPVPADKLEAIQEKAAELRDARLAIADLEERLTELNKRAFAIATSELPELLTASGIDHIGLPASGNSPAVNAKLTPFYRANIAASWDADRRQQAFKYLEEMKAEDLIKTQITISLPREARPQAKKLMTALREYSPVAKESVHNGTLSAWLREQIQDGTDIDLDLIGGEVGTMVELKPRKE